MIQAADAARLGRALGGLWCGLAAAATGIFSLVEATGAEPGALGPTYNYQAYNVEAGLPHNSAGELLQTRDGYLWVGTDSGLARFDGIRFVNYRIATAPGLADNLIRCLYEDKDGTLWIGTQRGLSRMRHGTIELVEMPRVAITSLTQDRVGRVWIATLGQGLWMYRDGRATACRDPLLPAAGPECEVRGLFADSTGRVWLWIRTKGVAYLENDTLHLYEDGLKDRVVLAYAFVENPRGTLWLGTNKGLLRLRGGEVTKFGLAQGLPEELIRGLYADPHGQVWAATNRLYRLTDPAAGVFVEVPLPAVDYNLRAIIQDNEGSYWVGSAGYGIARMQPSGFRTIPAGGLLPNGVVVRTVSVDPAGNIWAALPARGAVRIAPDGKASAVDLGADANAEVWAVLAAADGSVWLGARGALHVWRDGHLTAFPQFQRTRALFEDRAGAIWIGAEVGGGVVRYQNGAFTKFDDKIPAPVAVGGVPIPRPLAYVFAEDAAGAIYAGLLRRGVIRLQDGVVTRYETDTGFPASDIRAIYPAPDGTLWVGTRGSGLLVLDRGRWLHPDALSEPFNDQVSTILEDHYGRLWLGTPKGIVWVAKAELLAVARGERPDANLRLAGSSEGIQPGAVGSGSTPAIWKTPDGILWFATRYGLIKVDPETLPFNAIVPPVRIERVLINDQPAARTDAIELSAGARSLAIDYTALSFVRPGEVRFRYRLDGYDAAWTNAGVRRTAFYTKLPPGRYRFQVIACNDDGVWNTTGAGVDIVQQPFFYQTTWFWGAVAIVFLLAGPIIYRLRTAALRRRNEELERRIAARTVELAQSNEAIRASEYFYHSLVESLPQIIVRKDAEGRFTYANAAYAELIGRSGEQIVGLCDRDIYPPEQAAKIRADDGRIMDSGRVLEYENVVERPGQKKRYLQVKKVPLFAERRPLGVLVLFWDMTVFRETEELLRHAQQELLETSRLAGIAEVATGVLHNLGNALNSVNTSATLATERLRKSKVPGVGKAAQLLLEQGDRLAEFLTADPRGRQLPDYLQQLAAVLQEERAESVRELEALQDSVDHMKQIVAAQQSYAHVSGLVDVAQPAELVEFALRISEASLGRHRVTVIREFSPAPAVRVERHKVLQILINLIRNAKEAINESLRPDKELVLGIRTSPEGRAQIYVTDNGVGIAPEALTRVFGFGFTTKINGHGFGLHTSANAAKEMGGSLDARSDGPGQGATFILELPPAG
jgi:PAS domain S-box-containing protein